MRDIIRDAAIVSMAKQYEVAHYTAEQFVNEYTDSPEARKALIEFLVNMEMIYKRYPENEWLHPNYDADPTVYWMTY